MEATDVIGWRSGQTPGALEAVRGHSDTERIPRPGETALRHFRRSGNPRRTDPKHTHDPAIRLSEGRPAVSSEPRQAIPSATYP